MKRVLVLGLLVLSAGCGDGAADTTPLATIAPTTTEAPTTTTLAPTSTSAPTTTLVPTTTASPPTTAPDPPPGAVTGLEVGTGGGSMEVAVIWTASPEPDLDRYDVFYSELPGGPYALLRTVAADEPWPGGGRVGFVDFPYDLIDGKHCFRVRAVDLAAHEGPLSAEACLSTDPPPGAVTGLEVGTGGGSMEVAVIWSESPEPDLDRYDVFYSELPGGPYALLRTVAADEPWPGGGRVGFVDFPYDLIVGRHCFRVRAVDLGAHEGPLSAEACFSG